MEEKKPRRLGVGRRHRYPHPRDAFEFGRTARQREAKGMRESGWEKEKEWKREKGKRDRGGGGCTFACRAAVWLRCAPTTHAFCSYVPQPAALGFNTESENGFLLVLFPRTSSVPMTTRRISRPLLPHSARLASARFSYCLKFQSSTALFPPLPTWRAASPESSSFQTVTLFLLLATPTSAFYYAL